MIKPLMKVGIEGAFLNIIKAIYERPTGSSFLEPRLCPVKNFTPIMFTFQIPQKKEM